MITLQRLTELLDYDPITGKFTWLICGKRMRPGQIAGSKTQGYINISLDGTLYRAHRLAWLYMRGRWPENEIDHCNGDGTDNRITNLREANRSQNIGNSRVKKISKSGLKGVHQRGRRYLCSIGHRGKRMHLGVFDTAEAAHQAYIEAARKIHGEFARAK